MKKAICLLLTVIMVLMLTACGTDTPAETTSSDEAVSDVNDVITHDPAKWQYYVYTEETCNSKIMGEFHAMMYLLNVGRQHEFNGFINYPVITEEFISSLKDLNEYYRQLEKIYYDTRSGNYPDVSVTEFLEMDYLWGNGDGSVVLPLRDIQYNSSWNPVHYDEYYNGQWHSSFTKRYANGVLELNNNYYCWVAWYQNITTPEGQDDSNAQEYRRYQVENPNQDAYLFVINMESGYSMIHITPEETT